MNRCYAATDASWYDHAPSLGTAMSRIANKLTENPNVLNTREKIQKSAYYVSPARGLAHHTIDLKVHHTVQQGAIQPNDNRYVSLDDANAYIRAMFDVRKRYHYNRGKRPKLSEYKLPDSSKYAIICTHHEYIFANQKDYYASLYDDTEIIEVWTIRGFAKPQMKYFNKNELQNLLDYTHARLQSKYNSSIF